MNCLETIGQKDFYDYYVELCDKKGITPRSYKEYSSILKDANLLIRDSILFKGEKVNLSYRLGELFVHKYENKFDIDKIANWKVNWKKTKELGTKVYFESKYGYKWKWNKKGATFKGKKFYTFQACRKASRLVSIAINEKNLDFYN